MTTKEKCSCCKPLSPISTAMLAVITMLTCIASVYGVFWCGSQPGWFYEATELLLAAAVAVSGLVTIGLTVSLFIRQK